MAFTMNIQLIYLLRLLGAALCGAMIGYERESHMKMAGIRTHAIVALASSLMMIISKYGFYDILYGAHRTRPLVLPPEWSLPWAFWEPASSSPPYECNGHHHCCRNLGNGRHRHGVRRRHVYLKRRFHPAHPSVPVSVPYPAAPPQKFIHRADHPAGRRK